MRRLRLFMRCRSQRRTPPIVVLAELLIGWPVLLCGCTHQPAVSAPSAAASVPLPLAIKGQDTSLHLRFPQREQTVQVGEFQRDEICYLKAGDFRIDCFTDGSSINLGPNDSTSLLSDNPMYGLESSAGDKLTTDYLRIYGIIFLVGGTVDRLPQALSDYIADPNQHLNEAIALAQLLLNSKTVELRGYARGGEFIASMRLTDSGRDKLVDALDQAGESTGPTQLVGSSARKRLLQGPPKANK